MNIDRNTARMLGDELRAAARAVAERHGMALSTGGVRYGDGMVRLANIELKAVKLDDSGEAVDPEAAEFARLAPRYGLKPDDLGRQFTTYGGKSYTIMGIKPSRRKYPISAEGVQGGRYKFAAEQVRAALERG